jgi:D-arabinose 1-dehydrogenase-like Zn-dependent alcohol dehydrogenase
VDHSCHSDCHQLHNEWKTNVRPLVPGHEIVGIVVRRGDKAVHSIGDRVAVGTLVGCCMNCPSCIRGEENYCRFAVDTYTGTHAATKTRTHGGFAKGMVVDSRFAFKVPESLPSTTCAPLMCAGATVFSPIHRYCKQEHSIGVVGIGGLGHFALQFARALGMREVVALTTSADKAAAAQSFGASHVLVTTDKDAMKKRTGTLDFLLVTVSAELHWQEYIRLLKVGGHLCLVGLPPSDMKLNPMQLTAKRIMVSGSNTASLGEIREMLDLSARQNIRAAVELLPLSADGANEAVRRVMNNTPRYRCVLVNEAKKL